MPFSNITKRFSRPWQFITQYLAGENATRSGFDIALNDFSTGLNDAIIYLEGRDNALASAATDLRYIGPSSGNPAARVGGTALQAGDFYFNTTVFEIMVYTGGVFKTSTRLTTAMLTFLGYVESDDKPSLRAALGLGTAAVQNIAAFATAAQGVKADSALLLASGAVATNVLDWHSVHASGTGFYEGAAGASNNPGTGLAYSGIYVKRSVNDGVLRVTDSGGRTFQKIWATGTPGAWVEVTPISLGQSWHTVTRSTGTYYQNTTGRPIMVSVRGLNGSGVGSLILTVNSTAAANNIAVDSRQVAGYATLGAMVPPGHYYQITVTGVMALDMVQELS